MILVRLFRAYLPRVSVYWWLVVLAFSAAVFAWSWLRDAAEPRRLRAGRAASAAALWGYAFLLLVMLVLSRNVHTSCDVILEPLRSWRKFFAGTPGSFEWGCLILFNGLLFLPLGFFFAFARSMRSEEALPLKRLLLHAAALGGCTSLLFETLQLVMRRGVFELDDILHNTLGAVLGALLWRGAEALLRCIIRRNDH